MTDQTNQTSQPRRFRVVLAEQGMTLRQVLRRRFSELSQRGQAAALIQSGGVYLDNIRVRISSTRVIEGERITVYLDGATRQKLDPAELVLLARGSDYLVVDKPAGVLLRADRVSARGTISEALVTLLKGEGFARPYVGVVHPLPGFVRGAALFSIRDQNSRSMLRSFTAQPCTRRFHIQVTQAPAPEWQATDFKFELRAPDLVEVEAPATVTVEHLISALQAQGLLDPQTTQPLTACTAIELVHPISGEEIFVSASSPSWADCQQNQA